MLNSLLRFGFLWLISLAVPTNLMPVAHSAESPPPTRDFARDVAPFLQGYCVDCHQGRDAEGKLDLQRFSTDSLIQTEYDLWDKVARVVADRRMPPQDAEQPSGQERAEALRGIQRELQAFDCTQAPSQLHVTLRRLNRDEYNRTIHDLLGVAFRPADDFPSDDVGYGFDNVADVLSLPPLLLEKYLDAAESIMDLAFQDAQTRSRILVHPVENEAEAQQVYRRNIFEFAERAFRRPLREADRESLSQLGRHALESGAPLDEVLKTVGAAILVSPHFLFRAEQGSTPISPGSKQGWLDDYTLASRLSYFLWSSMPDASLFDLARRNVLHEPDVLTGQFERMLADPKAEAFVTNFAGQWLQLRLLAARSPDPARFPNFNDPLREAMREETTRFFASILREDRSVLEFLSADYSFVNEPLAKLYGLDGVHGNEFQRVALPRERRGVLTQASVLLITSNPTRTSPVKRGKWILENLLGEPPPPPPPNVPLLNEQGEELGTLRERMEQHRVNPACAVCHTQMDTLGFGLENFDVIGAWRERDGRHAVDAQGVLPGGLSFQGAAELAEVLAREKQESFTRCLTEKLLIYALGRGLQPADRCALSEIQKDLAQHDYRFQSLLQSIVLSDVFRSAPIP